MFRLDNLSALVTGASGGIGRAIACALASQGARLILSGTRLESLEDCAHWIAVNTDAPKAVCLPCNLHDGSAVEQLIPQAELLAGKLDILVNNAGITRDNLVMRMKDDEWQEVIDVNLTASFRLVRAGVKAMMKNRFGRIINISSVVATMGNHGQGNYCASKAGLIGLSKAVAMEVATRGITVNCIAPGFIDSAMTQKLNDTTRERILTGVPMGRMGLPEEVAAVAVFLASGGASYITGQTIHVNGGLEMV